MHIAFPLEFAIQGVPVSLQASGRSRERWKQHVAETVRNHLPDDHWAEAGPIAVTIYYFPEGRMVGDIDNIVKPILDALCQLVYADDEQVDRILVQKFEEPFSSFTDPTPCLAGTLAGDRPIIYIRVDNAASRRDEP